jgi:hypothetical protein
MTLSINVGQQQLKIEGAIWLGTWTGACMQEIADVCINGISCLGTIVEDTCVHAYLCSISLPSCSCLVVDIVFITCRIRYSFFS